MADGARIVITATSKDIGKAAKTLHALAAASKHPAPLMKRIARALEGSTKRRFRSGEAPDGTPWKPSIRAGQMKSGKTLMDKGRLRDSITSDGDDEAAVVGTNLVYAAIHQKGGTIKAKDGGYLTFQIPGVGWRRVRQVVIPARPFLGVSNDDQVEIAHQVEAYLAKVTG